MSKTLRAAEDHLSKKCKTMKGLIREHGPCRLKLRGPDPFNTLVRSIISQQLSVKAAATILQRVEVAAECEGLLDSESLIRAGADKLRACGVSGPKVKYALGIAELVQAGELDFKWLKKQDDETAIAELTKVKGIGQWTAEMFLMFAMGRLDILSTGDVGLQRGAMLAYELDGKPDSEAFIDLAQNWRPYRSVASWYLWRAAEM